MNESMLPVRGSNVGKNNSFRKSAETIPNMKKSYHSTVAPISVDATTIRLRRASAVSPMLVSS
ncbi:hypothetical protein D3C86_2213410 [compost metagenome]